MRRSVLDMERLEHQLHILMEILNRQLDAHTWNSGRRYNIVVVSKAMKQVNILVVLEATDTQSSMKIKHAISCTKLIKMLLKQLAPWNIIARE